MNVIFSRFLTKNRFIEKVEIKTKHKTICNIQMYVSVSYDIFLGLIFIRNILSFDSMCDFGWQLVSILTHSNEKKVRKNNERKKDIPKHHTTKKNCSQHNHGGVNWWNLSMVKRKQSFYLPPKSPEQILTDG